MKKILISIFVSLFSVIGLSSCVGSEVMVAAASDGAYYYDTGNSYLIIYRGGVPYYQMYDYSLHHYYFRPVPRDRYIYIKPRPHIRRDVRPMRPMDSYRPNRRMHQPSRNHQPDRISPQPRPDSRGSRPGGRR